jgi:hypothetical protein
MELENCKHGGNAPRDMLAMLPGSQGGLGRHKCAVCAYQQGRSEYRRRLIDLGRLTECDHGSVAPTAILKSLGDSQAGAGRHKCVVCAYQEGRAEARNLPAESAWGHYDDSDDKTDLLIYGEEPVHGPIPNATEFPHEEFPYHHSQRLQEIGLIGELLVVEHEKRRLTSEGLLKLAEKVTHVSREIGDGEGYDILSYTTGGRKMYIEVKTTLSGNETPFYLTRNEARFAADNAEDYCLYRLYELNEKAHTAKFFVVTGDPGRHFKLTPLLYSVSPR